MDHTFAQDALMAKMCRRCNGLVRSGAMPGMGMPGQSQMILDIETSWRYKHVSFIRNPYIAIMTKNMSNKRKSDTVSIRRIPHITGIETMAGRYVTHKFKPHAHSEFIIGLIDEGVHLVWCRGEYYSAAAGTIVTMRPGDIHHGGPAHEDGWVQRMMYIDEALMTELVSDGFDRDNAMFPDFRQPFWPDRQLADAFRQFHRILHTSPLALARDSAMQALVKITIDHLSPFLIHSHGHRRAPEAATAVRDYLHENANDQVYLSDLCNISGLGRRQTIDIFKHHFGLPPHAYHLILKINSAKQLLLAGIPVAEVATTVGFADQSHLTRHFRAIVGVTPSAYKDAV